jgi:hypothetical protein
MTGDNLLPFCFPAVRRKTITAAFDGGRISSDGGVMLLAEAERRLGIADQLARVIPDERDADRVTHLLPDILRARIFAIACGYEDADDLDRLRFDPAFKLACGRLPDSGRDLCSQPTISRWEDAPSCSTGSRSNATCPRRICCGRSPGSSISTGFGRIWRRSTATPGGLRSVCGSGNVTRSIDRATLEPRLFDCVITGVRVVRILRWSGA